MTKNLANALSGYFEVLFRINQNLLKLCGANYQCIDFGDNSKILDLITDIPRVVPFKCTNKKNIMELNNRDGLLEFKGDIDYLESDYLKIFTDNYDFLNRIRIVRNKCEHRMHSVVSDSIGMGCPKSIDNAQFNSSTA